MISSMTGYGRGEVSEEGMTAAAEIRTVNSRFLEVSSRLPRTLALRENDVKEMVRARMTRGKVNIVLTTAHDNVNEIPLKINAAAAKAYYKLLTDLRRTIRSKEKITLDHLLKFPEVLEADQLEHGDEQEWLIGQKALALALDDAALMRKREGEELCKDLEARIREIESVIDRIHAIAKEKVPEEKARLEERLQNLLSDQSVLDAERLELEIALFADRLDITEECVRFHSHNKFFLDALHHEESAGRKLNFLIQEMNREANTIGSKTSDSGIAHLVVGIKEELEKVREQLQNIE